MLLVIGTEHNMEMHQFDVVSAYLNADLEEKIYMRQPPGYEDSMRKVLRLQKALYGLKQGSRKWNIHFNQIMVNELGFQWLNSDPCVYIWQDKHGLTIIGVHVDDMIALADTTSLMDVFAASLAKHIKITSLGMPSLLFRLKISHDRPSRTLSICQLQYILHVLEQFSMADTNAVSTPLNPNIKLVKTPDDADLSEMRNMPYQVAIGSLMYAALGTQPDISYTVQALSQYSLCPGPKHWTTVKRVFQYLKGTHKFGITFTGKGAPRLHAYYINLRLEGYSNADWGSNPDDRQSISGYAFLVGNAVVAWSSKKQTMVVLSSMEVEYMAITYAACHRIWMRAIMAELTFAQEKATKLNADNKSAIKLSKDNVQHARSKHIDICHHFIRECIAADTIYLEYCPTNINSADLFMKALPCDRFQALRTQLGILLVQS